MHLRAHCHAEWPRRGRAFQHSSGIELMSPNSLWFALTTEPLVCSKQTVYESSYFATCNRIFCIQDCCSRIIQVLCQGQARNTRYLERKPLIDTFYRIRHRLELNQLKYFHFAHFLLSAHRVAHRAAHRPRKSGTDNLKLKTDLWDRVMDGWSVTQ